MSNITSVSGNATFGEGVFGVFQLPGIPFYPSYETSSYGYVPRGGGRLLDVDMVSAGNVQPFVSLRILRDAHGGILMVRGWDRLMSRIVRALATVKGDFWADPSFGSDAVPGLSVERNAPMQLLSCVLTEIARYSVSRPRSPSDRLRSVLVRTATLASDARSVLLDIVLYTEDGGSSQERLSL